MILTHLPIDIFDNFHSNVSIVRTTDRTCTQHVSNRCLIIRASNGRKILCRGLFDDIRTTNGFNGRSQTNDFTYYVFCHCIYFLLANPYKHLDAQFCTENKTWNIREFRNGRCWAGTMRARSRKCLFETFLEFRKGRSRKFEAVCNLVPRWKR